MHKETTLRAPTPHAPRDGSWRTAKANMTNDQPRKIRPIPTKVPITQLPSTGH